MLIEKYSLGVGDRYGHQGTAQLKALLFAKNKGLQIVPVWNKSKREHSLIGSKPMDARKEADNAVKELGWKDSYYIDADHIGIKTVDDFIQHCNFFTIDVADFIGEYPSEESVKSFTKKASNYKGEIEIPGIARRFEITENTINAFAKKYLVAINEAARIYNYLVSVKGPDSFVTEVSVDENEQPQTPEELFFILLGLSLGNIKVQTIAPKFTGRFNKGIDYVGNVNNFIREFEDDICVIKYAVKEFSLPSNLKLSIHSGSDKFSIYPVMGQLIKKYNKGIHLKTDGTTWLEEVIGMAMAGEGPLALAKSIYGIALSRFDELCGPYRANIDIDQSALPSLIEIQSWNSEKFVNTLRHIPGHPDYNPNFRQLMHVAFKIAAEYGTEFISILEKHSDVIGEQVTTNLYDRHICRLFNLKE
jgi:tagaturonate epimerase